MGASRNQGHPIWAPQTGILHVRTQNLTPNLPEKNYQVSFRVVVGSLALAFQDGHFFWQVGGRLLPPADLVRQFNAGADSSGLLLRNLN